MTNPRDKFTVENAIGDGNCAFNAFILGLTDEPVLSQLKLDDVTHSLFIHAAKIALELSDQASAQALIEKLGELRKSDSNKLQLKLAPVLRKLAITLAEKDQDNYDRTLIPLQTAFRNYMGNVSGDDIFKRLEFVKKKLAECKQQKTTWEVFAAWWKKEGYNQFLQEMAKDKVWAGDLELYQLGKYFGVNVRELQGHEIYSDRGTLSIDVINLKTLTDDGVVEELRSRGVIGQHPESVSDSNKVVYKSQVDAVQYNARIMNIPNHEAVTKFISNNGVTLITTSVPASWSEECLTELKQRGVINQNNQFQIDAHTAMFRIGEIPKINLVNVKAKDLPMITLTNSQGVHWDNMRLKKSATKNVTFLNFSTDPNLSSTLEPAMPALVDDAVISKQEPSKPVPPKQEPKPEPQKQEKKPSTLLAGKIEKLKEQSGIDKEGWNVAETVAKENHNDYYKVTHNDNKKTFLVYENKLTTLNTEIETFVAMMKAYRAIYGETPPSITTHHEKAKDKWKVAYKVVYGKDASEDVITVAGSVTPSPSPKP